GPGENGSMVSGRGGFPTVMLALGHSALSLCAVMQMSSAGAMPLPAPMAGHRVRQVFNCIVLSFVRRVLDLLLCRLPTPGQGCPRLQRSLWLAIMGVGTRQEIVLGANRAVAKQTPSEDLCPVFEEVLQHFLHVRGDLDWHAAVMVVHLGFLTLFGITHGRLPLPWQSWQVPEFRQGTQPKP